MSRASQKSPRGPAAARDSGAQPRAGAATTRVPTRPSLLQRVQRGAGNGVVQRLLGAPGGRLRAPAGVGREIERRRGAGRPLDAALRGPMERSVGADLGSVRLHTDGAAGGLTDKLDARAFTSGSDVFFSPGAYRPDSSEGRRLLAHELTHVAQQAAGRVTGSPGEIRPPGDTLEREADATARRSTAPASRPTRLRRRRERNVQRQVATPVPSATEAAAASPTGEATAAVPDEEGGFWASIRNLGAGARDTWNQLSDVASEWAPKIIGFLTNPVGALLGHGWLELPDRYKPPILNTILEYSEAIFARIHDAFAVALGPVGMLWPVIRHFMLGFLRRMKEVPDALKVALSNRLALLMTGGSLTFMLHFAKGMALGIWDVIRLPYDLVVMVIDGAKWIADWLGRKSGDEQLATDQEALQEDLDSPENDPGASLSAPERAFEFLKLIWEGITGAVEQMGRGLSQALIEFFQLPDEQLGEQTGRLAGGIAFDLVLSAVSAGIAAILRRVAATAVQVVRLIKIAAQARKILTLIGNVVRPLAGAVVKAALLFRGTRFAGWLSRFKTWLARALKAAFAADIVLTLHEKGEGPEELAEEDEAIPEEEPGETEAGPEVGGPQPDVSAEATEEPEFVDFELIVEESEVDNPSPEDVAALGLEEEGDEFDGTESVLRFPILRVKKVPSGTSLEKAVLDSLRHRRVDDLPKMKWAELGQHTKSGHGIDIYCGYKRGKKLYLYRIEVKGGRVVKLGMTKYGPQGGVGWSDRKVKQLTSRKPTRIKTALIKKLMKHTGIKTVKLLRMRLRTGRNILVHHKKTRLSKSKAKKFRQFFHKIVKHIPKGRRRR